MGELKFKFEIENFTKESIQVMAGIYPRSFSRKRAPFQPFTLHRPTADRHHHPSPITTTIP
jgi:hypothetical protein